MGTVGASPGPQVPLQSLLPTTDTLRAHGSMHLPSFLLGCIAYCAFLKKDYSVLVVFNHIEMVSCCLWPRSFSSYVSHSCAVPMWLASLCWLSGWLSTILAWSYLKGSCLGHSWAFVAMNTCMSLLQNKDVVRVECGAWAQIQGFPQGAVLA